MLQKSIMVSKVLRPGLTSFSSTSTCQLQIRYMSSGKKNYDHLVLIDQPKPGVTVMKMNDPKKLNGWTQPMMERLFAAFQELAQDPKTKVGILTGADPYYCAGVNLSATIRPMHPAKLHSFIYKNNKTVFDTFITFPKPLIIAMNGPAIGACVTSATLSDAIVASEKATLNTPFSALAIPPEGCSSVHFERIMGVKNAQRMLGPEGWKPTAAEAKEAGFVHSVVPHEKVVDAAVELAEKFIAEGKKRTINVEEYLAINDKESKDLADAFLGYNFLNAQYEFLSKKNKKDMARIFWIIKTLRPLWATMLPKN